jgi:dihydrofolate reductase
MRTLTYFVATTADGFIARPDGSFVGFLPDGQHLTDLFQRFPETVPGHMREAVGVSAGPHRFDAVLMGRKTYDVGLQIGITSPYPHLKQYVFSRSLPASTDPTVEFVSGDPLARVRALKREAGRGIWLCGGGELAGQLLPEIDELFLKVNPVVFGAGIPVIAGRDVASLPLTLLSSQSYANGVVLLHYRIERQ